jgi:GNAT superfamily N-acetyltransferase
MSRFVRSYQVEDRVGLGEVIDSVCAESPYMATRRFEPTPWWNHALTQTNCACHHLLVACDGDQLLGWCRLFPIGIAGRCRTVRLGVGVLTEYRGQGWGSRLLKEAQPWTVAQGVNSIVLWTHCENKGAIRFFLRCGFETVAQPTPVLLEMSWSAPASRAEVVSHTPAFSRE